MQAEFLLKHPGGEERVGMQDILDLAPVEFTTVMRTGAGSGDADFTGVELRNVREVK